MNLFLYTHGGSGNHGCEAIVRSTVGIFEGSEETLYSFRPWEDCRYHIDELCEIVDTKKVAINKFSLRFLLAYVTLKIKHDYVPLDQYKQYSVMNAVSKESIALSIGGDNYCYAGAEKYRGLQAALRNRGIKMVLWGCSVEPNGIDKWMRDELSRYNLVTARESITYEALKPINPNTILAPDPAFTLQRQLGNYPQGLGQRPYIGINISPLVQGMENGENITMKNYQELVRYILATTDSDIALIPHVVWDHNDDRIPLGQLYEQFEDTGRVYMVEDQNCMQLKDIISGCEFFVGARTHSTIAAYSTCVPTLVVGYSVKARGIARDLFGTEDGYVLPVQQLKEKDDLTNAFKALYSRKEDIRKHLTDMMPGYIRGIDAAREAVENL